MAGTSDSLSPALERVLANFSGILRSVCWRYHFTGDDVDELVQEVQDPPLAGSRRAGRRE